MARIRLLLLDKLSIPLDLTDVLDITFSWSLNGQPVFSAPAVIYGEPECGVVEYEFREGETVYPETDVEIEVIGGRGLPLRVWDIVSLSE